MNSREYFEKIKHYSANEEGSQVADLLTIRATTFIQQLALLFQHLKQQNLCKNVIKSIRASTDLPSFGQFPRAHQVTFLYYQGLLAFLEAEYPQVFKFGSLILQFHFLSVLPSPDVLSRYPNLETLYKPFIDAIRDGNVKKFDDALAKFELRLVAQNTFLTVELAREIAMRVLFKKV
ncbi:12363_t:CDS:2 [Racocetra fulgida]|uniref:12363_t:CDS:1 n=1 Tax=Racocetra fulgida TaxID=60492 RepID=A0A9N8WKL7_9GLOM|nr:12363_t:CDS:2 [Racocetra fulgida]